MNEGIHKSAGLKLEHLLVADGLRLSAHGEVLFINCSRVNRHTHKFDFVRDVFDASLKENQFPLIKQLEQ